MSEVYKIQVNDSEPIEVSQQVYEVSFCFNEMLKEKDKEIERLNKIRQQVIDELFELKDMIYKPKTREINFDVQRKISSMIVKLGSDKK